MPSDANVDTSSPSLSLRMTQGEIVDQWAVTPAPLEAGLVLDGVLVDTPPRDCGGGSGSTHMAASGGGGGGRQETEGGGTKRPRDSRTK